MEGTLVILRRENKILSLLYQGNRPVMAHAQDCVRNGEPAVGDIYVGKVRTVVKNIEAAFVETARERLCFLPLGEARKPVLLNRTYDGRLLQGDELLVQIQRAAVKTKEATATAKLSFTGKYAVVTVGKPGIGFSGKLSAEQKKRLQEAVRAADGLPGIWEEFGLIIRTNAGELCQNAAETAGREPETAEGQEPFAWAQPLFEEVDRLTARARHILAVGGHRTCFSCLYSAPPVYLTDIRDTYGFSYGKIITDDPEIFGSLRAFLEEYQPSDLEKLQFYEDTQLSLTSLYNVETRLREALQPRVWLRSGGYLVIEPTEALTVIDVNSGKFTGKKEKEDTFYRINLEAAKEAALQLRLRNLSGIILIDFINMDQKEHEEALLRYLEDLLRQDPVKTSVVDMTPLGLVEITRKKGNATLARQLQGQKKEEGA